MKNLYKIEDELYVVSNNEDISENCWIITNGKLVQVSYLLSDEVAKGFKVILTTNKLLIKDGVQAIDDEFLEWVSNNIDCEYVEVISAKSDVCNCYYPKFCKSTMLDYKTHCGEGENIKDYFKIIIPERESKKEILEHKSKFIVFILENDNWVQESIPLNSFEEADEFCQHLRDRKICYLICQILKQGCNGK